MIEDNTNAQPGAEKPVEGASQENQAVDPQSTEANTEQPKAQPRPQSFQEEIGGEKEWSQSQTNQFEAGQRVKEREMNAIIQQQQAEIDRLKGQQTQPQSQQPQNPTPQTQPQPVQDDSLRAEVEEIKLRQHREVNVAKHVQENAGSERLKPYVMEMAGKAQYKNLSTHDLFALAAAQNPEPQAPPEAPPMQQATQQVARGTDMTQDSGGSALDRLNAKKRQEAEQLGIPYEPFRLQ